MKPIRRQQLAAAMTLVASIGLASTAVAASKGSDTFGLSRSVANRTVEPLSNGFPEVAVGKVTGVSTNPAAKSITRKEIIQRAEHWWRLRKEIPYNMKGYYEGYRTDCSGYVSMAWKLTDEVYTGTLHKVAKPIAKKDLKPGDVVNWANRVPGKPGHVVIFDRWTTKDHSRYMIYDFSSSGGIRHREIPYPYTPLKGNPTWTPMRYNHVKETQPIKKTPVDNAIGAVQVDYDRVTLLANSGTNVLRRDYTPSTSKFTAWEQMKAAAATSALTGARWSDDTLNIVAKGSKARTLTRLIRTNKGTWLAPQTLITPTDVAYRPNIVAPADGEFVVAYVDTKGELRLLRHANGDWGTWLKVGEGFTSAPSLAVDNGNVTIFVATNSTQLQYRTIDLRKNTFSPIGIVKTPEQAAGSSPAVALRVNGQLIVAIRGANNHLYKATHRPGEKWQSFTDLGAIGAKDLSSSPVISAPNNEQLMIASRGRDGVPMFTSWSAAKQWGPWKAMK